VKVAILGCGPAGLLAAHACAMNGAEFEIFSKKRKSFLFGSQYLHEPIPGISDFDKHVDITYQTNGSPVDYRKKVHGTAWDGIIAPEDFEQHDKAWNIREAYDRLWGEYGSKIRHYELPYHPDELNPVGGANFTHAQDKLKLNQYDLVVSTVPRTFWKMTGDQFIHSTGWTLGDAPEQGTFCHFTTPRDNMIICDGTPEVGWTRLSRVFGYTTIEWPIATRPPIPQASQVIKPLRFESGGIPFPTNWLFAGRYGEWHKGVLVTHAFTQVLKATAR
jgi:hypothetical protein